MESKNKNKSINLYSKIFTHHPYEGKPAWRDIFYQFCQQKLGLRVEGGNFDPLNLINSNNNYEFDSCVLYTKFLRNSTQFEGMLKILKNLNYKRIRYVVVVHYWMNPSEIEMMENFSNLKTEAAKLSIVGTNVTWEEKLKDQINLRAMRFSNSGTKSTDLTIRCDRDFHDLGDGLTKEAYFLYYLPKEPNTGTPDGWKVGRVLNLTVGSQGIVMTEFLELIQSPGSYGNDALMSILHIHVAGQWDELEDFLKFIVNKGIKKVCVRTLPESKMFENKTWTPDQKRDSIAEEKKKQGDIKKRYQRNHGLSVSFVSIDERYETHLNCMIFPAKKEAILTDEGLQFHKREDENIDQIKNRRTRSVSVFVLTNFSEEYTEWIFNQQKQNRTINQQIPLQSKRAARPKPVPASKAIINVPDEDGFIMVSRRRK